MPGAAFAHRTRLAVLGLMAVFFSVPAVTADAADRSCAVSPRFGPLVNALGSGLVGPCVGDAYHDANGGGLVQSTSHGLLTWSNTGGWAAFTDGISTWVDGPGGLIRRTAAEQGGHVRIASAAPLGSGNLVFHGGFLQEAGATNFAIFWHPPGTTMSAAYQPLVERFLKDIGGTPFLGTIAQYYDQADNFSTSSQFGGSWVDTSPYPGPVVTDLDVYEEVQTAIFTNQWALPKFTGANYFVFVASGEGIPSQVPFAVQPQCGYHGMLNDSDGSGDTAHGYAVVPYAAEGPCGLSGASPNGDAAADAAVNNASRELFGMVTNTDPFRGGWVDATNYDMGDKCAGNFGTPDASGANIVLNGNPYIVQQEWSNATSSCAFGIGAPLFPLTVSVTGTAGDLVSSSPGVIWCDGKPDGGSGPGCSLRYVAGTIVTLQPTIFQGQVFVGWGGACSGAGSCTVNMSSAQNVSALFTPPPVCTPRPQVNLATARVDGGGLQVTISTLGSNVFLQSLQFGTASNASIDAGAVTGSHGNVTETLQAGTTITTFMVHRPTQGVPTTVPLMVVDSCGAWPTFVGGGPAAF